MIKFLKDKIVLYSLDIQIYFSDFITYIIPIKPIATTMTIKTS